MKNRIMFRPFLGVGFLTINFFLASGFQANKEIYVKGTVSRSGKPVRSVWVVLKQDGNYKGKFLTGDDGKYFISNLDEGNYEIAVEEHTIYSGQIKLPENNSYDIKIRKSLTSKRVVRGH